MFRKDFTYLLILLPLVLTNCGDQPYKNTRFFPSQAPTKTKTIDDHIPQLIDIMDQLRDELYFHANHLKEDKKNVIEFMYGNTSPTIDQMKHYIESDDFDNIMKLSLLGMDEKNDPQPLQLNLVEQEADLEVEELTKDQVSSKNFSHGAITMVIAGTMGSAMIAPQLFKAPENKAPIYLASHLGVNGSLAALSVSLLVVGSLILADNTPSEEIKTAAGALLAANAGVLIFRSSIFWKESISIFRQLATYHTVNTNSLDKFNAILHKIDKKLSQIALNRVPAMSSSDINMIGFKNLKTYFSRNLRNSGISLKKGFYNIKKYQSAIKYLLKNNRNAKIMTVGLGALGVQMLISGSMQSVHSSEFLNLHQSSRHHFPIMDRLQKDLDMKLLEIYQLKQSSNIEPDM